MWPRPPRFLCLGDSGLYALDSGIELPDKERLYILGTRSGDLERGAKSGERSVN
jgi:hypothetical protein